MSNDHALHVIAFILKDFGDFEWNRPFSYGCWVKAPNGNQNGCILGKMNEGEGTLGLLLNDPSLYEDLKQLVGGAQRSTLVRAMVRMSTSEAD